MKDNTQGSASAPIKKVGKRDRFLDILKGYYGTILISIALLVMTGPIGLLCAPIMALVDNQLNKIAKDKSAKQYKSGFMGSLEKYMDKGSGHITKIGIALIALGIMLMPLIGPIALLGIIPGAVLTGADIANGAKKLVWNKMKKGDSEHGKTARRAGIIGGLLILLGAIFTPIFPPIGITALAVGSTITAGSMAYGAKSVIDKAKGKGKMSGREKGIIAGLSFGVLALGIVLLAALAPVLPFVAPIGIACTVIGSVTTAGVVGYGIAAVKSSGNAMSTMQKDMLELFDAKKINENKHLTQDQKTALLNSMQNAAQNALEDNQSMGKTLEKINHYINAKKQHNTNKKNNTDKKKELENSEKELENSEKELLNDKIIKNYVKDNFELKNKINGTIEQIVEDNNNTEIKSSDKITINNQEKTIQEHMEDLIQEKAKEKVYGKINSFNLQENDKDTIKKSCDEIIKDSKNMLGKFEKSRTEEIEYQTRRQEAYNQYKQYKQDNKDETKFINQAKHLFNRVRFKLGGNPSAMSLPDKKDAGRSSGVIR